MKRGIQNLILFVILFSFTNCEKKTQAILYDSKYKKEIAEVRKQASLYLVLNNIPGASLTISKDGKIIYSEGMGFASKELEVPVTRNTKFRIGEVSELFTSMMYQMMVENGTLHPDSAVQTYIPDYPESVFKETKNKILLNQLANHSSGITSLNSNTEDQKGKSITLQKSIDNFKDLPLEFVPGWYESQSTNNYNLLGAIMEKATGKYFHVLLKEYITDTLNLNNTEIDNPYKTIIGRSDFFDFNMVAQVVNAACQDLRHRSPSEGMLSNAEDLVKFGNAILNSDRISNQIKERLFVPQGLLGDFPPSIANAWIIQKNRNNEFYYGKVGGVIGGGAVLLIVPEEKLVFAVTVNLTSNSEIPVFTLFESFLEKTKDNGQDAEKNELNE
jgi:CubicO group peptidase (beta-lactamase class C family)